MCHLMENNTLDVISSPPVFWGGGYGASTQYRHYSADDTVISEISLGGVLVYSKTLEKTTTRI